MDLRYLQARINEQKHSNSVFTFEKGQVVQRSHADVYSDVQAACSRLTAWGLRPGMRVGIFAPNCYEWIIYDLALTELRAVIVAFTDDFATTPAAELCDKYSLSLLLLSKASTRNEPETGIPIAYLDADNNDVKVIERGEPANDPDYDRVGCIFSSGSSGGLKGLSLNRRGIEASVDMFTQAVNPRHDDCLLLFLPISNFQQRLMYYSAFWYGFNLIVTDPNRLFRALKELHPTILIAPPTLYEAFETRFYNLPKWKRLLAQIIADATLAIPVASIRKRIAGRLFKELHEALGGRMRFMVTGMAPIKHSTLKLCQRMQLPLFETYGLIEFGSISLNLPGANKIGSVGRLLPGVHVKFAEDGEIIAHREHTIAFGYFECAPGESEKSFIGNGHVATGDIGRMDADGYLYLVGRKKEIIITSGGLKVHPEALEAEINACPDVKTSVVFRSPEHPSLVAVVLPNNPQEMDVKERIKSFIDTINARHSSVNIGKVIITAEVFTRENGFLRPNLKFNRKKIAQHFESQIEDDESESRAFARRA